MSQGSKRRLLRAMSQNLTLTSVLSCASLGMMGCAGDLTEEDLEENAAEDHEGTSATQDALRLTHPAATNLVQDDEQATSTALQVIGAVGGRGGTSSSRPGLPDWPPPGTIGAVGGSGGTSTRWPSIPGWPPTGTIGPLGGSDGAAPRWPSIPGWPPPETIGPLGGSDGASPTWPGIPGWPPSGTIGPLGGSGGTSPGIPRFPRPGSVRTGPGSVGGTVPPAGDFGGVGAGADQGDSD